MELGATVVVPAIGMRLPSAIAIGALALALVALLVEAGRTLGGPRRRERRAEPAQVEEDAERAEPGPSVAGPTRTIPAVAPPSPAAVPRPLPARVRGTAQLRGRVVLPSGDDEGEAGESVKVTAEDGVRVVEADVEGEDMHFELHLPPGRYTLTARSGSLVGAEEVIAEAGTVREVTIGLEAGVEIGGQTHNDEEIDVVVRAFRAGSHAGGVRGETDGGSGFSVTGLRAGQAYDLTFTGDGIRPTTVRDVVAPTQGLDVNLTRLPVLRGTVGVRAGESCPVSRVQVAKPGETIRVRRADDDDDDGDEPGSAVDDDCTFELTLPADATQVRVVATGSGWHLEEEVAVPAEGDPPPLCLNAPC
jgi:hypothetical protein